MLLSLPLLVASGCTRPAESIYGGPEMLEPEPAPSATDSTTPEPEKPVEADPPEPSEPQGEIYGSPQTMDSNADEPKLAPGPESGGNPSDPDDSDEADPKEGSRPDEPIYGGPEMMDPQPGPIPKKE